MQLEAFSATTTARRRASSRLDEGENSRQGVASKIHPLLSRFLGPQGPMLFDENIGRLAENASKKTFYEEYHPYGTSAYRSFASSAQVSARRYRYTGKERDEETSLCYYGARYYAPWLGRWTAADPMGLVDGPGLYTYARGSPITLTDPNGTQSRNKPATLVPDQPLYKSGEEISVTPPEGVTITPTGEGGPVELRAKQQQERAAIRELGKQGVIVPSVEDPARQERLIAEGFGRLAYQTQRQAEKQGEPATLSNRRLLTPVPDRTKEESVSQALREKGKAAGIRTFNEEEFNAFVFLVTTFGLPGIEMAAGPASVGARTAGGAAYAEARAARGPGTGRFSSTMGSETAETAEAAIRTQPQIAKEPRVGEIALGRDPFYKDIAEQTGGAHWRQWAEKGITRRTTARFGRAFHHAAKRADAIHFELTGIDDPVAWANLGRGGFGKNVPFSAAELHIIRSNPELLRKTIFYRGGVRVPSPF